MVRKKFSKREMIFIMSCAFLFILILSFYIWHQMEFVRMGYEIEKLEEEVSNMKNEIERLEATKASLLSLDKVEKSAKENLKLVEPKKEQIVYDEFNP